MPETFYQQGGAYQADRPLKHKAPILSTDSIKTSGTTGIGYATGAGGAVTQITSKSTGVTLNKLCGTITTHAASLTNAAEVGFTVTNSLVAANDVPVVALKSGGTADSYQLTVDAVANGSFRISISNCSSGSLGEALVISFIVLKGVAS